MSTLRRLALLTAVVLLGACSKETPAPATIASEAPLVRTVTLSEEPERGFADVTGFLRAHNDAIVSAEVSARVLQRPREKGSTVKAGEPVVLLDTTRLALEEQLARVAAEEATLSPDVSATERATSKLRHDLARDALARCRIPAPFDGVVEELLVDVGEWVMPGTPVARVIDYDELRLVVTLAEEDIVRVAPGARIEFRVDAFGEAPHQAEVVRRGRAGHAVTRKFELELRVLAPSTPLGVGMFARARIPVGMGEPVIAIPKESVFKRYEQTYCYVLDEGLRAHERRISVRPYRSDYARWIVTEGLARGERIVEGPLTSVRDGATVRIETPTGRDG